MQVSNNQNFVKTVNVKRTKEYIEEINKRKQLWKKKRAYDRKNKNKINEINYWQVFEYRLKESIRYDTDRKVTSWLKQLTLCLIQQNWNPTKNNIGEY